MREESPHIHENGGAHEQRAAFGDKLICLRAEFSSLVELCLENAMGQELVQSFYHQIVNPSDPEPLKVECPIDC